MTEYRIAQSSAEIRQRFWISLWFACLSLVPTLALSHESHYENALARSSDLRLSVYATSRQVEQLATDQDARDRAASAIRRMGISKVFVEVHRSGHVVPNSQLIAVRDWLLQQGIQVVGGIATVPGGDFGVRQEGPLDWFNWQNQKTQQDLQRVVHEAATIFDTFIVDDFFCTGDVSKESQIAKGDRSWGAYRRELLSHLAHSVIVGPAKEANPAITMIVKYPQWYDRFHLFGYDTVTFPKIFDQVWVGTETRGRSTQRFGFVQPYEGFVNFRWLAGIAGHKIGGAWFDHGDCREYDFLDQAYMSVLAGARELVFFNLGDVLEGHPDHEKVVAQFDQLADLAVAVRNQPAQGIPAYKPPNSDPAGDMYLLDFLGMLGVPIVPVHRFPEEAETIFLPAHAAADPQLLSHVRKARDRGTRLIVTTSLLSTAPEANQLASLLGVTQTIRSEPFSAKLMSDSSESGKHEPTDISIDLESPLQIDAQAGDVLCTVDGLQHALLLAAGTSECPTAILNTHTFSQADFERVGEVLLCPRQLGLLELSGQPLDAVRAAFHQPRAAVLKGPSCVSLHLLVGPAAESYVVQNFREQSAEVTLAVPFRKEKPPQFVEVFSGQEIPASDTLGKTNTTLTVSIPARGRVWLRRAKW
ncbi:MAG: hypothetical protein KDA57_06565 [Planctomycetales bacterium]|nr:hypothetical protein [Planctomycetales bacterium]